MRPDFALYAPAPPSPHAAPPPTSHPPTARHPKHPNANTHTRICPSQLGSAGGFVSRRPSGGFRGPFPFPLLPFEYGRQIDALCRSALRPAWPFGVAFPWGGEAGGKFFSQKGISLATRLIQGCQPLMIIGKSTPPYESRVGACGDVRIFLLYPSAPDPFLTASRLRTQLV